MRNLLLILVLACTAFMATAQKKDWAKYERYAQQNVELKKAPDVVFMGNSITDFWINNDEAFFKNNNFADRGISGQTTCEMLARFRQDVIDLKPKAVVILAGINDIAQNNGVISLNNILGNIISMCDLARYNGIKVVLCSVLPCDKFLWNPSILPADSVVELNGMIKKYATDNNIAYVDYYKAFATPQGGLPEEYSGDSCHPNLKCYKQMEPLVVKGINYALKRSK